MSPWAASRRARVRPAANVVSSGAKGLFHRAIFQSGGYTPVATKAIAQERGDQIRRRRRMQGR